MPEVLPPLSQTVHEASGLLEWLLENYRYCGMNGQEFTWESCYAKTWNQLVPVLGRVGTAMHCPSPNDGISAIWLRVVARMAHRVEKAANGSDQGYEVIVRGSIDSFYWLVNIAKYLGRKTLLAEDSVTRRLSDIAEPNAARAQIDELHQIASEAEELCHELQAYKAATRQTKAQKEIDAKLPALLEEAGQAILSYLNDGNATSDSTLDEVVLYAIGLDYKQVHPEYVLGALANLWLPKDWNGFPVDYWKNAGEIREDCSIELAKDQIAAAILDVGTTLQRLCEPKNFSGPYTVDSKRCRVTCNGTSFLVSGEVTHMLQLLLGSDSWVSMRANNISSAIAHDFRTAAGAGIMVAEGGPQNGRASEAQSEVVQRGV